jgi:hypothetical protein
MFVLGLVASPWAVLTIPAAMLIGFAFAAVGMAATTCAQIQDLCWRWCRSALPLLSHLLPPSTYGRAADIVQLSRSTTAWS